MQAERPEMSVLTAGAHRVCREILSRSVPTLAEVILALARWHMKVATGRVFITTETSRFQDQPSSYPAVAARRELFPVVESSRPASDPRWAMRRTFSESALKERDGPCFPYPRLATRQKSSSSSSGRNTSLIASK